ncbi:MAG: hypothetical protein EXR27_18545 [Betaproteobacteria bacterium]|nr:hypothetical protein [Betaproteobacteria bacterium]
MNSCADPAESPIAANAGLTVPAPHADDPYRVLDELMAVIEALCPVWPERGTFKDGGQWLL